MKKIIYVPTNKKKCDILISETAKSGNSDAWDRPQKGVIMETKRSAIGLQFFAGEGSGGAQSAETVGTQVQTENKRPSGQAANDVTTGENKSDAGSDDRRSAYKKFKAEYRDLYESDVSGIIKGRLKEHKELETKLKEQDKIVSLLSEKYGVSDTAGLYDAIRGDSAYWAQAAENADMTPEQYMSMMELQSKNKSYEKQLREIRAENAAREQYNRWLDEAKELKKVYPDFDLNAELSNPRFRALISARDGELRTSLKQAYELFHMDEIISSNKQQTAEHVIDNVKARGLRPTEAGVASAAALTYNGTAVENLTREQRAEMAKRASYGEDIRFS